MSQTDHIKFERRKKKTHLENKRKERYDRNPCEDWSCFVSSIGKLLLNIIFCRDASDEPCVNPTAVIYSSPELDENYYSLIFFSSNFFFLKLNNLVWFFSSKVNRLSCIINLVTWNYSIVVVITSMAEHLIRYLLLIRSEKFGYP